MSERSYHGATSLSATIAVHEVYTFCTLHWYTVYVELLRNTTALRRCIPSATSWQALQLVFCIAMRVMRWPSRHKTLGTRSALFGSVRAGCKYYKWCQQGSQSRALEEVRCHQSSVTGCHAFAILPSQTSQSWNARSGAANEEGGMKNENSDTV